MRQIGDRRLRWRRAPRFAEHVGAATWQQRATLSFALVGGLICVYLVVHLLGLEIRVPGLDAPARTPAFVAAPQAARQLPAVTVRVTVPTARPRAARPTRVRPATLTRSRRVPAPPPPPVVQGPVSQPTPAGPAPAAPPSTQAPAPPPQATPAAAAPPLVAPVVVEPAPSLPELPKLPELPVPSVPPLPALPVPLPTVP
jgi:hypothetical protein